MTEPEWARPSLRTLGTFYDEADCTACGESFALRWRAPWRRPWGTADGQPVCPDCRDQAVGPLCTKCYQPYPEGDYRETVRWGRNDRHVYREQCSACRTPAPKNPDRPTETTCQRCDTTIPMKRKGPLPKFCSSRCRVADHRERVAAKG